MEPGASLPELWLGGLKYLGRRPLVILTVAYLLGIIWADWAIPPLPVLVALLALAVAMAAFALLRRLPGTSVFLLLGLFLLGATLHTWRITPGRDEMSTEGVSNLPRVEATVVTIVGQEGARQEVILSHLTAQGELLANRARVALPAEPRVRLGEWLALSGVTLRGLRHSGTAGEFDADRELARQGVHIQGWADQVQQVWLKPSAARTVSEALAALRQRLLDRLTAAMPGPDRETYASLLASMVYGMQAAPVPDEIVALFKRTGTIHLLVVSGAQVSIIAMSLIFLIRGSRRVLPAWGMIAVTVALLALAAVAGMGPSVERAVAMAVVLLASFASGRRYDFPVALALSALGLCLVNTCTVFDLGAQLTYACCIGVYLAVPHYDAEHRPGQPWEFLSFVLWATVGAWLFVSPLIINAYHWLVLAAGVANLVDVPLSVLLLYLGLLAIGLGMIWAPLAAPACWIAHLLLRWILVTNTVCSKLPCDGLGGVTLSLPLILLWYAVVIAFLWALRSRTPTLLARLVERRMALAGTVFAVGVGLLIYALLPLSPRQLQMDVLDVGAGQCVLVRAPGGHAALLDAGTEVFGGGDNGDLARRRVLPFLSLQGVRSLDAIVLSHPHEDHCNLAAEVMNAIPTRRLLCGPEIAAEASWPVVLQTARERGVQVQTAQADGTLFLGDECQVEFLEPRTLLNGTDDDSNNNSLLERLQFGTVSILLPADLQGEGEQRAVYDYGAALKSDVMLAAHHASLRSDTPAFVQAIDPALVIISCGSGSRRPDPRALKVFGNRPLWRTDVSGTIHLTTDGQSVRVRGFRSR